MFGFGVELLVHPGASLFLHEPHPDGPTVVHDVTQGGWRHHLGEGALEIEPHAAIPGGHTVAETPADPQIHPAAGAVPLGGGGIPCHDAGGGVPPLPYQSEWPLDPDTDAYLHLSSPLVSIPDAHVKHGCRPLTVVPVKPGHRWSAPIVCAGQGAG
ncbi:hypothetical protein D3C72_1882400 [compost metagenome]